MTIDFNALTFADVTLDFGRRRALNGVSVTFTAGEIVAVLGPNGAGKTTLIFVGATLLRPSSGEVRFGPWTPGTAGAALRGRIGLVGHDLYVYSEWSAAENLRFFARLYHVGGVEGRVNAALARAGLGARAEESIAAFSRGMRQRLAIERALIHDPKLVLLDEPFTGLDEASTVTLSARLRSLREQGCIVVVTTHDIEAMEGLADRAVLLQYGTMTPIETGAGSLRERYRAHLGGGLRTAQADR